MQRQPTEQDFEIIRRLVGDVTPEQLRYVECYVGDPVSLFVPAVGPCDYARSRDHRLNARMIRFISHIHLGNKSAF
jgi:hypothetical protein